jgi:hypothetical protein
MKAYILNNKDLLELSIGDKVVWRKHPYIGDVPKIIDIDNEPSYMFRELISKEKHREGCDKLTFVTESGSKEEYFIDEKYSLGIWDRYERTFQNIGYSLYSSKDVSDKDIYVTCIPSKRVGMDYID